MVFIVLVHICDLNTGLTTARDPRQAKLFLGMNLRNASANRRLVVRSEECFQLANRNNRSPANLSGPKDFRSDVALNCSTRNAQHLRCVASAYGELVRGGFHGASMRMTAHAGNPALNIKMEYLLTPRLRLALQSRRIPPFQDFN
jgi:hypothetical protein